jgi:hypothetical protein
MKDWKKFEDALKNKVQKDYPVDEALWASAQAELDAHFPVEQGKRGFVWFMLTTIVGVTSIIGYVLSKPNKIGRLEPSAVAVVQHETSGNDDAQIGTLSLDRKEETDSKKDLAEEAQPAFTEGAEVSSNNSNPNSGNATTTTGRHINDNINSAGQLSTGLTSIDHQTELPVAENSASETSQAGNHSWEITTTNHTDGQLTSNVNHTINKSWPNDPLVEAMHKNAVQIGRAMQPKSAKKAKGPSSKPRKVFTYSVEADYTYTPWFVRGDSSGESSLSGSYTSEVMSAQSAQVKFNARWKKLELRAGIGRSVFNNQLVVNQRGFIQTYDTTYHSYRVIDSSFAAGNRKVWLIQTEYDVLTRSRPIEEETYNQTDRVRYWNIPLSLSYVQPIKRFELGVNLGVNVLLSPSASTDFTTSDTTGEALLPYSNLNRSLVQNDLSVRLGYRANYHTTLYAEVRNTWSGKHLFSTTSYAYRSRGMTLGINYRF